MECSCIAGWNGGPPSKFLRLGLEGMFGLLCSAALSAGPSGLSLTIDIFACFLPALQVSSTFHEGEWIRLEAVTREETGFVRGQRCYLRGLLSHPKGLGVR